MSDPDWPLHEPMFRREVERYRRLEFVRERFVSCLTLRRRRPNPDGTVAQVPYEGQEYDPAVWQVVEEPWETYQCPLCWRCAVRHGEFYRVPVRSRAAPLCEACYRRLDTDAEPGAAADGRGR